MVKYMKEELDVEKASRVSPAGTARAEVEEAKEQIVEEVNEGDFVTCLGFSCMHSTVEGNNIKGQTDRAREEEGHRKNRMKGDKTGRKQRE
jgi:hypothetical protein